MIKRYFFLVLLGLLCPFLSAKQYFLSPAGNDSNNGLTLQTAWLSPNTAFSKLVAGDTLWVKGGTYSVDATVKAANPATKTSPVLVSAVGGEKPVFDCTSFRHYGSESSTYRGMDLRQPFWRIRGIKIYKAGYNGVIIAGENITLEGMTVEECGMDGIALAAGAVNAYILNCDSYRNCNVEANGENGDGFAAKEGTGTVFRGCRAWENADDGWDVYGGNQPILVDSCWSYGNGVNYWADQITSYQGDGNGFKLGGGGGVDGNAPNVVLNSFAFGNVGKGFDQNHNSWGITCINCTGYNNHGMGNFAFEETPTMGKHVMINNLSYAGTGQAVVVGSTETTNSWNFGLTFTDDMFESLSVADYKVERDSDYHLTDPRIKALFKLKSNNPAIDKGTVQTVIRLKPFYAIPYSGTKPDLGGKEFDTGSWTFPTPDERDTTVIDTTATVTRPTGTKTVIVNVASQFTVTTGAKSTVWGPFHLASAESAVFDFQAVGSSSGVAVIEFSKDNKTWEQVGTQAKNGSTSYVTGKLIDLSADTAPWGPTIYIRFNNTSTKDVNIKNLLITGTLYTLSAVSVARASDSKVVSETYYNLNGQKVMSEVSFGLLIRKTVFESGHSRIDKTLKIKWK
jgi:hypothetical protein